MIVSSSSPRFSSKGSVLVFTAVALVTMLSFAAFVIDLGFGFVARNELHNISDSACLAAARQLGNIYTGLAYDQQQNYVLTSGDRTTLESAAQAMGTANQAGNSSISINASDITVGQWDFATRTLTTTTNQPNAVRVIARRDSSANGPLTTFLAGIMGYNTMSVSAQATAAISGVSVVPPATLDLPVGLSQQWFANNGAFCNQNIQFYPTNSPTGCAGWSTFDLAPANASTLRNQILQPMLAGTYSAPGATAGQTQFNFIGGNVASALPDLRNLYLAKRDANGDWKTFVPVYSSSDCSNPSGSVTIIGFATVIITNVLAPPAGQLIQGHVECQLVEDGRGGGGDFGTLGSIPGLVQ